MPEEDELFLRFAYPNIPFPNFIRDASVGLKVNDNYYIVQYGWRPKMIANFMTYKVIFCHPDDYKDIPSLPNAFECLLTTSSSDFATWFCHSVVTTDLSNGKFYDELNLEIPRSKNEDYFLYRLKRIYLKWKIALFSKR